MNRARILLFSVPFLLSAVGGAPAGDDKNDKAVRRENTPPLMSLYLPIPLGVPQVEDQATGVFVPANYRAGKTIDLLVFLRGYDINRPKPATSVKTYWGSPQHPTLKSFQFREEVNRSGKNVILAVPALGPRSEFGKLKDEGGVQDFLGQILDGLWHSGPHAGMAERPTIRYLILAAHSGGGVPLRRLAQVLGNDNAYKDKLKECWGFDSIYGVRDKDADFWAGFAKAHPGTKVSMFYIFTQRNNEPTNTSGPALDLERQAKAQMLGNVAVVRETKAHHNDVPITHLADLIKAAPYLEDR